MTPDDYTADPIAYPSAQAARDAAAERDEVRKGITDRVDWEIGDFEIGFMTDEEAEAAVAGLHKEAEAGRFDAPADAPPVPDKSKAYLWDPTEQRWVRISEDTEPDTGPIDGAPPPRWPDGSPA